METTNLKRIWEIFSIFEEVEEGDALVCIPFF